MKLPPIWAELPPFENPEIAKRYPPIAAEITMIKPSTDAMRTPVDFDHTNESAKTTTARIERRIPTDMCNTARDPRFSTAEKNPVGVTPLDGAKKMFTVSPDHPCRVRRPSRPTNRILKLLVVRFRPTGEGVDINLLVRNRKKSPCL